jgi:hypothetical protein
MEEEVIVRNPTRELRALFLHMSYTLYSALFALRCLLCAVCSLPPLPVTIPCSVCLAFATLACLSPSIPFP